VNVLAEALSWTSSPEAWVALLTLTLLEIVLGIDNLVFISILAAKLPPSQQPRARSLGLGLAMLTRVGLLFALSWLIALTAPLFTVLGEAISGRDLILVIGGLFLIAKATSEIHGRLEGGGHGATAAGAPSFASVIVQILLLDVVFSIDSVITAVGMARELAIMVIAVVVAILIMIASAGPIAGFVARHPTVKMLALAFLIMIGMVLVAEGFDLHVPKGYVYFAMGFSVFVEFLNLRARQRGLHDAG
jgi:predicted tellurium resistance membrane protein TerC